MIDGKPLFHCEHFMVLWASNLAFRKFSDEPADLKS